MKKLTRVNTKAVASFNSLLNISDSLQRADEHRTAEWFDTPTKRMQWWLDLEKQWQRAFREAVFFEDDEANLLPTDEQLIYLFEIDYLGVCGKGATTSKRNNNPDISFQLTNLSGVTNLTNLTRLEFDYNQHISSLEPLRHLTKLRELWCDNNAIVDLSPISLLPELNDLCCWNNQIEDLSCLTSLLNLSYLYLSMYGVDNPIKDYTPLLEISGLRQISLKLRAVPAEIIDILEDKGVRIYYY